MSETTPAPDWLDKEPIGAIEKIELLTVRLPFVAPFGTSVAVWNCKEALRSRSVLRQRNDRLGSVHHKKLFTTGT
jgi:hypothetical protein